MLDVDLAPEIAEPADEAADGPGLVMRARRPPAPRVPACAPAAWRALLAGSCVDGDPPRRRTIALDL